MMITVNIVRAPTIRLRPLSSTPYAGDALVLVLPHHVRWKTGPRQPGSPGCRLCACAGAQVSGGSGGGGGLGTDADGWVLCGSGGPRLLGRVGARSAARLPA